MLRQGWRVGWVFCLLLTISTVAAQETAAPDEAPREPAPWEDDVQLHDLQFITTHLGWAVGDQGVVWRTTDGGETWEAIRTEIPCPLRSVCFLTDRIGWAAGGG